MKKFKKITKYIVNGLNMVNAIILVLSPIWGWNLDKISKTIIGLAGIISTYLVSGKLFEKEEEEWKQEYYKTMIVESLQITN